jgi:hypothetical protein
MIVAFDTSFWSISWLILVYVDDILGVTSLFCLERHYSFVLLIVRHYL